MNFIYYNRRFRILEVHALRAYNMCGLKLPAKYNNYYYLSLIFQTLRELFPNIHLSEAVKTHNYDFNADEFILVHTHNNPI